MSEHRPITGQTLVIVEGEEPVTLTFDDFAAALADGIDDEELTIIKDVLYRGEVYRDGGGAEPEWSVRLAEQHTPGPWFCVQSKHRPHHFEITRVPAHIESESLTWVSREPDGHLIASAPDLLAAVKTAERFMAGFEGDPMQDGIDADLATIRTALAKAEGRS